MTVRAIVRLSSTLRAHQMAVRAIVRQVIPAESSSNGCASHRRMSNPSKLYDHVVYLTRCTGSVASPRFEWHDRLSFMICCNGNSWWVLGFR